MNENSKSARGQTCRFNYTPRNQIARGVISFYRGDNLPIYVGWFASGTYHQARAVICMNVAWVWYFSNLNILRYCLLFCALLLWVR